MIYDILVENILKIFRTWVDDIYASFPHKWYLNLWIINNPSYLLPQRDVFFNLGK